MPDLETEAQKTEPSVTYGFDKESWLEGYKLHRRIYKGKTDAVFTVLFGILAVLFVIDIVRNPTYSVNWFCFLIALGVMLVYLLGPVFERRSLGSALDELKDDRYELTVGEKEFTVRTILPNFDPEYLDSDESGEPVPFPEIEKTAVNLSDKTLKVRETESIFAVFTRYNQVIIPKKDVSEEQLGTLRLAFKLENR